MPASIGTPIVRKAPAYGCGTQCLTLPPSITPSDTTSSGPRTTPTHSLQVSFPVCAPCQERRVSALRGSANFYACTGSTRAYEPTSRRTGMAGRYGGSIRWHHSQKRNNGQRTLSRRNRAMVRGRGSEVQHTVRERSRTMAKPFMGKRLPFNWRRNKKRTEYDTFMKIDAHKAVGALRDLGSAAKSVLRSYVDHADSCGITWLSRGAAAKESGVSYADNAEYRQRAVGRHLRTLVRSRILVRVKDLPEGLPPQVRRRILHTLDKWRKSFRAPPVRTRRDGWTLVNMRRLTPEPVLSAFLEQLKEESEESGRRKKMRADTAKHRPEVRRKGGNNGASFGRHKKSTKRNKSSLK